MVFDFSLLENINLSRPDNVLFLFIILILFAAVLIAFLLIILETTKSVKSIFRKIFGSEVIKNITIKKQEEKLLEEEVSFTSNRMAGGNFMVPSEKDKPQEKPKDAPSDYSKREEKDISGGLSRSTRGDKEGPILTSKMLSSNDQEQEGGKPEGIKMPRSKNKGKATGGDFSQNLIKKAKPQEEPKNNVADFNEKEKKGIAEGLSKLKGSGNKEGKPTLTSKMPSREKQEQGEGGDKYEGIKIPRRKKNILTEADQLKDGKEVDKKNKDSLNSEIKEINVPRKENKEIKIAEEPKLAIDDHDARFEGAAGASRKFPDSAFMKWVVRAKKKGFSEEEIKRKDGIKISSSVHDRDLFYGEKQIENARKTLRGEDKKAGKTDTSIFGGKSEISRSELRQKLEEDKNVWRAEESVGLNMTPLQKANLEKEVFSSSLGGNISKRDMRLAVKKLNDKLYGAKSSSEHTKIRKQIKFFKKIGGIK